jgi:ferrochelatase
VEGFDSVLLIAFGGPDGPADVRPFLANVTRGRPVPPERLDDVAHHYERFGGVSPITACTTRQAEGLRTRLAAAGAPLPVYVGMRNWRPFLADTLAEMSRAGVRRTVGFIMAAHACYSSREQYHENVADARRALADRGLPDVEIAYVGSWHDHDKFIAANAALVADALRRVAPVPRSGERVFFTAHSIPRWMAEGSRYREELMQTARLVAARAGLTDWTLAYQSRSGRPEDPWLEPDIGDALRAAAAEGLRAAAICPIGFVCDHIEVLYDLDVETAALARALGIETARASTVHDHPLFLDMMAEVVLTLVERRTKNAERED